MTGIVSWNLLGGKCLFVAVVTESSTVAIPCGSPVVRETVVDKSTVSNPGALIFLCLFSGEGLGVDAETGELTVEVK